MIRGAAQGDAALLVVPAAPGEFEAATGPGAQTREHAVLLRALGVQQVVVAVNKMDCTLPAAWSAARFHQVCAALRALLVDELQFRDEQLRFVPVSGQRGQNLVAPHAAVEAQWHAGPSLLQALDALHAPARRLDRAFRARAVAAPEPLRGAGPAALALQVSVLQGRVSAGRSVGVARCAAGRVHFSCARVLGLRSAEDGELCVAAAGEKACLQLALPR